MGLILVPIYVVAFVIALGFRLLVKGMAFEKEETLQITENNKRRSYWSGVIVTGAAVLTFSYLTEYMSLDRWGKFFSQFILVPMAVPIFVGLVLIFLSNLNIDKGVAKGIVQYHTARGALDCIWILPFIFGVVIAIFEMFFK